MCAQRLVLVPDNVYKGLVSTAAATALSADNSHMRQNPRSDIIPSDEITLSTSKAELDAIKRRKIPKRGKTKGKDISEKKALYEQEFRRYLKLRKQFKDQPIKVQLQEGPKVALVPNNAGGPNSIIAAASTGGLDSEDEEDVNIIPTSSPYAQDFTTPLAQSSRSPRVRNSQSRYQRNLMDETMAEFKGYILANRAKFNISNDGKHVVDPNRKSVLLRSNVDEIVERLVNPTVENAPSPIGLPILQRAANADPYLRSLIFQRFRKGNNKEFKVSPEVISEEPSSRYKVKTEPGADKTFKPQTWNRQSRRN